LLSLSSMLKKSGRLLNFSIMFTNKIWLWIGLAVLILVVGVVVYTNVKKSKSRSEAISAVTQSSSYNPIDESQSALANPISLGASGAATSGSTFVTSDTIGTLGSRRSISRSECRNACRLQCGKRPFVRNKKNAYKYQCWENCRKSICAHLTEGDLA